MELKKPLTLEQQVDKLISHNMTVKDRAFAKKILSQINYYRFTGYALQFRDPDNRDDYLAGTNFETVLKIHEFDTALRCALKPHLDFVELYARSKIAYGFSSIKCKAAPYDQHYDPKNFYRKDSHADIINNLDVEKEHSKDSLFVQHHAEKYKGKMPLWVIVELISFTTLSKIYNCMYISEQEAIASSMDTNADTLKNHLHCLANLRNKVAHAGRLYNAHYNPPAVLGRPFLQKNKEVRQNTFFAYILVLLRRLPERQKKEVLVSEVSSLVDHYRDCLDLSLLGFTNDYKDILPKEQSR